MRVQKDRKYCEVETELPQPELHRIGDAEFYGKMVMLLPHSYACADAPKWVVCFNAQRSVNDYYVTSWKKSLDLDTFD